MECLGQALIQDGFVLVALPEFLGIARDGVLPKPIHYPKDGDLVHFSHGVAACRGCAAGEDQGGTMRAIGWPRFEEVVPKEAIGSHDVRDPAELRIGQTAAQGIADEQGPREHGRAQRDAQKEPQRCHASGTAGCAEVSERSSRVHSGKFIREHPAQQVTC